MKSRSFVPAVLLLTLAAPAPGHASSTGPRSAAPISATSAQARPVGRDRAGRSDLTPDVVNAAGDYLRATAAGADPGPALRDEWARFYPACDATIRNFSTRFFRSPSDVDDCAQEVWIDLVRNLPDFALDDSRGRFTSWLFTIVRNKATDMTRRAARRPADPMPGSSASNLEAPDDDPVLALERRSDVELVRDALAKLKRQASPENYQILHLRQIEGRDVGEVAATLGISPRQVWAREHRMKRKLREVLSQD